MRRFGHIARRGGLLAKAERGSVSVELAFALTFFFALLVGVAEFGLALNERGRLESAAHAGAVYAAVSETNAEDETGIADAALADADDDGSAVQVSSDRFCQCADGNSAPCSGTSPCTGGAEPRMYVTVTAQLEREPLFRYPFIPDPWILTHEATIRVR